MRNIANMALGFMLNGGKLGILARTFCTSALRGVGNNYSQRLQYPLIKEYTLNIGILL